MTTTTAPPPSLPPVTVSVPTTTTTVASVPSVPCVGVALTSGQATIDAYGPNTTFCLSGTHNWTLTPRSGDRLIGPAVLDGGNVTQYAIQEWTAANVVVADLEVRNYTVAYQQAAIRYGSPGASGWTLQNLNVHDNGTAAGGYGAALGPAGQILGGRYYNNRQGGIALGGSTGATVDGAEIDHNNFTNNAYTTRNLSCDGDAGGLKWGGTDNITVKNSNIHDNACNGVWSDINSKGAVITNNQVYNNWDEGIFIEISSNATITHNTVTNNGWHTTGGPGATGTVRACPWLWGAGIVLASSDRTEIAYNTLAGNCNGITGTQQNRPQGIPGLLQNNTIHDKSPVSAAPRHVVKKDYISENGMVLNRGNRMA